MCGGRSRAPEPPPSLPPLPPLPPPRAQERLPSRAVLLPQQRREVQQQFANQPAARVMTGAMSAQPGGDFAPPGSGPGTTGTAISGNSIVGGRMRIRP